MKILVVSMMFAPDPFRINDITRELSRRGHEVTVITGLPDYTTSRIPKEYRFFRKRREILDGCEVIRLPILSRRHGVFFRALNYLSFAISGFFYALFSKKRDIDAILVYQTSPVLQAVPAVFLKKRLGVPLILYCLDLWPESLKIWHVGEKNPVFRLMKRISGRLYRACDRVAVSSEPFIPYLESVCRVPQDKLSYLPQGCDDFCPDTYSVYEDNGVVDFLFAGNVGAAQNVDGLLRAAALLPADAPFRLHIVGDGTALSDCRTLCSSLGLSDRVIFHGRHPAADMPAFYRMADCMLLTLRGGGAVSGTLPAKMQSYLCTGKPVVAAIDGAGAAVMQEADCGICAPPDNDAALAAAMQEVIQDFAFYQTKGQNGRVFFEEHFTQERFLNDLTALLSSETEREPLETAGGNP